MEMEMRIDRISSGAVSSSAVAHTINRMHPSTNLAASVKRPVLAEGDHVVHVLADCLRSDHRGRDAAVTDDLGQQTGCGKNTTQTMLKFDSRSQMQTCSIHPLSCRIT